jgi:hypothetical protein
MEFNDQLTIYPYSVRAALGITFLAKSIIIQGNKKLYIISPANFDTSTLEELKSQKKDIVIIAPNNFHNVHLKKMKEHFEHASFLGPKRSAKVSQVHLDSIKDFNFEEDLQTLFLEGHKALSETCFYHPNSKSLILTDLLFNTVHSMNLATRLTLTMAGTYHQLEMSRLVRFTVGDKKLFKKSMQQLLKFDFNQVIVNHGVNITRDQLSLFIDLY